MNRQNMLQKIVSLGSALTNGMLLASISYTLFLSAASLFRGPLTTPTHIGQVSLFATGFALMGLGAMYAAVKTGAHGIHAAFHENADASHTIITNNLRTALLATAMVSFFSGIFGFGTSMVLGTVSLAVISFVFALLSMEEYQLITA